MKIKSLVSYGGSIIGLQIENIYVFKFLLFPNKVTIENYFFISFLEIICLFAIFLIHVGFTGGITNNDK
jgi:hypothetical protein